MNELQQKAIAQRLALEEKRKARNYSYKDSPSHKGGKNYVASLRSRADSKGLPCTVTPEWIVAKLAMTHCEATGLQFSGTGRDPFSRTIDRKDSAQGYTPENCWVVCWIYNRAKLDGTHEDVMRLAHALVGSQVQSA